ncbi:MAG: glycosyltransferase [Anaerolineales bacterium]|nr:glycosyltransferase [Anaerolineales bacterium]
MNLLLLTASYPYDGGGENNFLNTEVQYLCQKFERVILVPRKCNGTLHKITVPIEIDETYSAMFENINLFLLFGSIKFFPVIFSEITSRPSLLLYPQAIKRLITFVLGAYLTNQWVETWLTNNKINPAHCLFYTYWFDQASFGIGLLKRKYPEIRIISRTHGYDLYEEYYYNPPYWPLRKKSISLLDGLYPDSHAGLNYLQKKYPDFSSIYEAMLLGVTDPGFTNKSSADGVFRIFSCSMLVDVKRVDLILEGIATAASLRPHQNIEWHHVGNGIRREELQKKADTAFPSNAKAQFLAYQNKETLMKFYKEQPIDVFMNVSETEGTPVAVMEAISCGVPVIATSVGGNAEIVSKRNGILLNPNPTPEEIAQSIFKIIDNPDTAKQMRIESRKVWQESYNADFNFKNFVEKIQSIRLK